MKPNNQRNRYNGRYNNNRNNNRSSSFQNITRHTALESSGPCGKLHGTALQLSEKYTQAAKDALIQNDRVLSETCMQFADHYARLQNQAIQNEQASRPAHVSTSSHQGAAVASAPVVKTETDAAVAAPAAPMAPVAESDSLPDFSPVESVETADELSEEDKTVQAMDLSIPIHTIQQNHRKKTVPIRTKKAVVE